MYMGNLSFDLLQRYLELLLNAGLIEIEDGQERIYNATEKGLRFLEDFRELDRSSKVAKTKKLALERSLMAIPDGNGT
jgi:predicted transcriptional regulator